MKPTFFILAAYLGLLLPASTYGESIWFVYPEQARTIQVVIDDPRTQDGDIVCATPGIYTGDGNWDVDFGGKNITVLGQWGPLATIIDCYEVDPDTGERIPHRGFIFQNGESELAKLEGFWIKNGYQKVVENEYLYTHNQKQLQVGGGAIAILADASGAPSNPTITGNWLTNNLVNNPGGILQAVAMGGAIVIAESEPVITYNKIENNACILTDDTETYFWGWGGG